MSKNGIEAALHQLSTDRNSRSDFKVDAPKFLRRFDLNATEEGAITEFDVKLLQRLGVSPLLTYGYWLTNAETKTRAAYLNALRDHGDT